MEAFIPEDIEKYAAAHSSREPELLAALAAETREKTSCPQMMVGYAEGLFLQLLVRLMGALRVLEIGTFTGYSALCMAEGLPEDGRLITCDVDPVTTAIARRYWSQSPHGHKIVLELGPALDTISRLEDPIDLVFIDADKMGYIGYWEACMPLVRTGGALLADNVLWSGRVLDPHEPDDRAIAAFNEHVARDNRVDRVVLPVRDGITVAVKR